MSIFDSPKNYRMRNPETISDFRERFYRLQSIWNLIVELMFEPIEEHISESEFDQMFNESMFISEQLTRIADDPFAFNHGTLSKLAYRIVDFSRACFRKKEDLGVVTQLHAFEYDALNMTIQLNNENYWDLGRR